VLLSRLLGQLGQVYSSVRLSFVAELIAPLNEPWDLKIEEGKPVLQETWDASKLEAFIMACARRGELSVRVDHADGSIAFVSGLFGASSPGASSSASTLSSSSTLTQLQVSPAELIRTRFSRLSTTLSTFLAQLTSAELAAPSTSDETHFAAFVKAAEAERSRLAIRRAMITRRAELLTELSVRKKAESDSRLAELLRKKADDQAKSAKETARLREVERVRKELEAVQKEHTKALAKNMAQSGFKIADEV
jgi:translation initiation factor 3 subunit A